MNYKFELADLGLIVAARAGGGWRELAFRRSDRGACRSDRTLQLSPGRASCEGEGTGITRAVDRA